MLVNIVITISVFAFMEFVAWFTHKYVMHGLLWKLHEDHHRVTGNVFQRNDLFFVIFALPSMALFFLGSFTSHQWALFAGIGILLYGLAYFFVHDILIHQRIKWFRYTKNPYFKALRKAHKVHHKHLDKEDGECFGMLVVPLKYFKV